MTKVIKILILLFAGIYFRCEANDSVVEVSSSGLVFSQEKNISMVSEKLEISPKEISVQYEFENTSKKEIEVTVGFPIPPFGIDWPGNTQSYPPDFSNFEVVVNGIKIQYSVDIRSVTEKGEDITAFLKEKKINYSAFGGFDITPLADGLIDSPSKLPNYEINRLSEADKKYLVSKGALREDGVPLWLNQITYFWKQKFPTGDVTKISHKYTPYTGGAFAYHPKEEDLQLAGSACIDPKLKEKMFKYLSGNASGVKEDSPMINFEWARYILVTANSWKMPIKKFELSIKKELGDDIKERFISLCWDGELKKVNENEFRSELTNFKPKKDLLIYWYTLN
jgi:hypothetical protein